MAKHRGTVYAVVRVDDPNIVVSNPRPRPVLIGVYLTLQRAEEIQGRSAQQFKDMGIGGFKFEVQPTTYYDE